MWIHHIGEIAMGAVALLLVIHFGLHILFKHKKSTKKHDKIDEE